MAYVGISEKLVQEVRGKILNLANTELQAALPTDPFESLTFTGDEPWFVKRVWGEHMHLKSVVPAEWLAEKTRVELIFQIIEEPYGTVKKRFAMLRTLDKPITLPPQYRTQYTDSRAEIALQFNINDGDLPQQARDKIKAIAQHNEIKARWEGVKNNVINFLENCKSLNEALKLWPDLRVYIPEHHLEKLDRKPEKKEARISGAAEILKTINTDEVQAAAVIARMSGARL